MLCVFGEISTDHPSFDLCCSCENHCVAPADEEGRCKSLLAVSVIYRQPKETPTALYPFYWGVTFFAHSEKEEKAAQVVSSGGKKMPGGDPDQWPPCGSSTLANWKGRLESFPGKRARQMQMRNSSSVAAATHPAAFLHIWIMDSYVETYFVKRCILFLICLFVWAECRKNVLASHSQFRSTLILKQSKFT